MIDITRRTALGILGGIAAPATVTVAVAAEHSERPEIPADKVARLAHELADALVEYADGKFNAVVSPSNMTDWPVSFRHRNSDLRQAVAETKAAMQRAYPGKFVHADILPYGNGSDCNVVIVTHNGDLS